MIVKEDQGTIWWPQFNLNTIGDLEPGEGYNVILGSVPSTPFYYDSNDDGYGTKGTRSQYEIRYEKLNDVSNLNTSNTMLLGIPETCWTLPPEIGDEIGVYSPDGKLIGRNIYNGGHTGIVLYGDDETTGEIEAIKIATGFIVKIWNKRTFKEYDIIIKEWLIGDGTYSENSIAIAKSVESDFFESGIQRSRIIETFPNPTFDFSSIRITIPDKSVLSIELLSMNGQAIKLLTQKSIDCQGTYRFEFDLKSYPQGIYIYKIQMNGHEYFQSIIKL
jgi:hypothetical protein